jgi:hypothetical protein
MYLFEFRLPWVQKAQVFSAVDEKEGDEAHGECPRRLGKLG